MRLKQQSQAWVIHRRSYLETSALLTVLTQDYGRLSLVARGAGRPNRKGLAGLLQPFQVLWLEWRPRPTLGTLHQAELLTLFNPPTPISQLSGLYVNELLYRLLPEQEAMPAVFEIYQRLLSDLQSHQPQEVLRYFEKNLLSLLGYGLDLKKDLQGTPLRAEATYCYRVGQGFQLGEGVDLDRTQYLFCGGTLLALAEERLLPADYRAAKQLLRLALSLPLNGQLLNVQRWEKMT